MLPRLRALVVGAFVAALSTAYGWVDSGHMVIAAIAYNHLTPIAKKEAERLLQIGGTDKTRDFLSAACWADDYRRDHRETAHWHYIDFYFRSDGKPATHRPDADNVVWAIHNFETILADKSKPDTDRADALRYLLHFVGDVHQPLHGTSRETDQRPNGDAGGNAFRITPPGPMRSWERPPRNLHTLWDFGCGLFPNTGPDFRPPNLDGRVQIESLAHQIEKQHPLSRMRPARDDDPMDWAKESFHTSVAVVYNLPEDSEPTPAYMAEGQRVSSERAALAGYRLANLLNKILK